MKQKIQFAPNLMLLRQCQVLGCFGVRLIGVVADLDLESLKAFRRSFSTVSSYSVN